MIKVSGHSDDLIEIEGDINEEFSWDDEEMYLAFSDGTVLSIDYTDSGNWRINKIANGTASYDKIETSGLGKDYSDIVTLGGQNPIKFLWVVCGKMAMRGK